MKEQALSIVKAETSDQAKRNHLREYLQHVLLRTLFEKDLLHQLVFHGGTALRMIHGLARFSEDLEFHLKTSNPSFELAPHLPVIEKRLKENGYDVTLTTPSTGPVQSSMVKFSDLLFESGLSPHKNQILNVKLEIDTNPPEGFTLQTNMINKYFPFAVHSHYKPSFLAGKLHAVLTRRYTKGRDYYDLFFYLNRWRETEPNMTYLRNALSQSNYKGRKVDEDNWRELVANKIESTNWSGLIKDVEPFLLEGADLQLLEKDLLLSTLRNARS